MLEKTLTGAMWLILRFLRIHAWLQRLRPAKKQPPAAHPARAHIHHAEKLSDRAADAIAVFAGSWVCVGVHAVWFTLWLTLRIDINLLTLIVSLEAIFLATFVLMTQNRQSSRDRVRDDTEAAEVAQLYTINQQQLELLTAIHDLTAEIRKQEQARKHSSTKNSKETPETAA